MNWDMIGALGEVIGAAAVVLTLFYLASQVRESSREAQRKRSGDLISEVSSVADSWGSNDELSDIVFRGLHDPSSLEPAEAFRLYTSLFRLFRAWEAVFEYSREGGLHQWGAEGVRSTVTDILGFSGAQAYWHDRKHWFSAEFRSEVEGLLAKDNRLLADSYASPGTA